MINNLEKKTLVMTPSINYLLNIVASAKKEIIIVSPWIKLPTLQKIIKATKNNKEINWKVLSRADHEDFYSGSSDIEAFRLMIENESFCLKALRQLHAKFYIVDGSSCLLTSANLTVGGMEINREAGIALTDLKELHMLLHEFDTWFYQAKILEKSWLVEEQKKLSETEIRNPTNLKDPFFPSDYFPPEEDTERSTKGRYRELPLPNIWIPTLDSLKEIEKTDLDKLSINSLISHIVVFYDYVGKTNNGKRTQQLLIDWFIHKKTLNSIGEEYGVERERISQKIGNREKVLDNIWNTTEGKEIKLKISLFLKKAIKESELILSGVLSKTKKYPFGLSNLDMGKFVCGLVDENIVNGNFRAKITSTNQLLIYDSEIFEILKKLDRIFHAEYQEFVKFDDFCRLGELGQINDSWFTPNFKLFTNLYLAQGGKIGSKKWSIDKTMRAIAWELADEIEYYLWHYSEMRGALKYIFPERFNALSLGHVNTRLSGNPDLFHFAGSRGIWQLTDLGDGYRNNKEAIVSIFNRMSNSPLDYKYIISELQGMGRRVIEGSIYALLERDESFTNGGQGEFFLDEKQD